MECKAWEYEEFPEYTDVPEGARCLPTTGDEMGTFYIKDVQYAEVDGISLHLQILLPLSRNHPVMEAPALVYVQGSGWAKQDVYHNIGRIAKLAERGYVIAITEYRHSGQAGFPAQIQDARNAIRFVRLHAEELHVNPKQIFAGGTSSGGHTALFSAILPEDSPLDRNLYPGVSAEVCGVLDYYGAVSFLYPDDFPSTTDYDTEGSEAYLYFSKIPGDTQEEKQYNATAVNYIQEDTKLPPVFIIHGTKDRIVNTRQSVRLYEKLKQQHRDVRLYLLEGADHGGPEFWSKPVVDLADEFMRYCRKKQE